MTATGVAGFIGQPPVVTIKPTERSKYEAMWAHPQYRAVAPGADVAMTFLREARLKPGAGSSTSAAAPAAALMIAMLAGARVHMLDFASNCLDTEVRDSLCESLTFTQHDLLRPVPVQAEYGYCTDVMEHLPPETVDRTLVNILQAAQHVFFRSRASMTHWVR